MRNENLELAQSSGSESSPSFASASTPRASRFTFDFGQSKTVDDLSAQFSVNIYSMSNQNIPIPTQSWMTLKCLPSGTQLYETFSERIFIILGKIESNKKFRSSNWKFWREKHSKYKHE